MKKAMGAGIALAILAGCGSIHQRVSPVAMLEVKQMCVIQNPRVRATFLDAYRKALEGKGFAVQVLPESANLSACPLVSNYIARWSWDLALYMSYAEFNVFLDGKQVGNALYNSSSVGGPSKFINAEEKVGELVNQLFPR